MTQETQPRKIRRWKGPEGRPARLVVNPIPDTKRDDKYPQERFIVDSFAASLAYFHNRKLTVLGRGKEPSDVDAEEDGVTCGIQVKRVRVEVDERERQCQRQYVDFIRNELGALVAKLDGLQITFLGRPGTKIPYLKADSRGDKGRELVSTIVAEIRALVVELESLPLNEGISCEWTNDPIQAVQGFSAWRFTSQGNNRWFWVFPQQPKNVAKTEALLAELVEKYVNMYTPSAQPLWLLLWEVCDGVGMFIEKAVEEARAVLRSRRPPFTEIWHFMPDGKEGIGSVYRIWPTDE